MSVPVHWIACSRWPPSRCTPPALGRQRPSRDCRRRKPRGSGTGWPSWARRTVPDSDHHRGGDGDGAAKVAGPTGHRTHPASALVRVWIWLVAAGVGWTRSIPNDDDPWDSTASMSNGVTTALIALGIGTAVGIAFGFATWWFTRYLIDDTQIRVD